MFQGLANLAHRHPWRVLIAAVVFLAIAGPVGGPVAKLLQPAGFEDPNSQSAIARSQITKVTGADPNFTLIALVRTGHSVQTSSASKKEVEKVARIFSRDPSVRRVLTVYQTHNPSMISRDGKSTYVLGQLKSASDSAISKAADRLDTALASDHRVSLGGGAIANNQINHIVTQDLARAELIAFPILFVLLLIVFRGVVAAFLPLLLGGTAILGTFLLVRLANTTVPLSVFILDIVSGLGLGLAIDYSLLMLSRYREELALVGPGREAIFRTLNTAGRTVLFSSITVMAALSSLLVFPQRFLYSMGVGGVLVTFADAAAALIVLPALLGALGPRINALAPKRWQQVNERSDSAGAWYNLSRFVMRHAIIVAILAGGLLLALGSPFLRVQLTAVDTSALPATASARVVSEALSRDFPPSATGHTYIAIYAPPSDKSAVTSFKTKVSKLHGAKAVFAPRYDGGNTWEIDVLPASNDRSNSAQDLITSIRDLSAPFTAQVGGPTAEFVDYKASIVRHLPIVLAIMALALFIVLFLVTGSIILPIKSFVMNLLTVSATFGSLVLIFQDGRLENVLRYTSNGALESSQPVLIFVIAFALSTDYGVFLLARIREARVLGADNETAVASGIQHTGGIVTAAAILFCVAMGSFITSQMSFIKQLGLGTSLSVILDATMVRALLVPSLMRLLGNWNWWAPAPLQRLQQWINIEGTEHVPATLPAAPPVAAAPAAAEPSFQPPPVPVPQPMPAPQPVLEPQLQPAIPAPASASARTVTLQTPPRFGSFVVEVGPRSGTRLGVGDGTTVGRDTRVSDVVLPDPLVSGSHAQVRQEGDDLVLYDLGSRNGVYVRGEKISRHTLHDGDLVGMGRTIVRFVAGPAMETRTQAPLAVS